MNRQRLVRFGLFAILGVGCLNALPSLSGQTAEPKQLPPNVTAPEPNKTAPIQPVSATSPNTKPTSAWDRVKGDAGLSPVSQQLLPTFHRGAEFLTRMQQPNGRFLNGWVTALNRPLEGDHFLRQGTATFALCRLAKFTADEKYTVRACQSVLALLAETVADPNRPGTRHTIHAPMTCDRIAGVAFVLMGIGELPDPTPDMLAKGEELTEYLLLQQKPDGSFPTEAPDTTNMEPMADLVGPALYGLALSHQAKPTPGKLAALKKALAYYRPRFQSRPSLAAVPWFTGAYALAYELSGEAGFAESVLEMNDWLCKYQYDQADPLHPDWRGGFQQIEKGKALRQTPDLSAAIYCQSLADACRLLRKLPKADVERYTRYRTALQRGMQYVAGLQFTRETTLHLAPQVGKELTGGFHTSTQDGTVRIEQTAWAVSALAQYFTSGAEKD